MKSSNFTQEGATTNGSGNLPPDAEPSDGNSQVAGQSRRTATYAARLLPFGVAFQRYVQQRPRLFGVLILISIALMILAIPVAYLLWWRVGSGLWKIVGGSPLHWLWAWFAFIVLFSVPFYVVVGGFKLLHIAVSYSVTRAKAEVEKVLDPLRQAEGQILKKVEKDDSAGLVPLLKYSRLQLEAYYKIGLSHTRRSFFYSIVAMWVGFVFIIVGFLVHIFPIEKWGLVSPTGDIKTVIMAGGAIIEFVSALFLWVYRNSTAQLTYFYNRQIYTHNVLMCFRIAGTMTQSDEAKSNIIDKVLVRSWDVKRPPPVGAKSFGKLFS